MARVNEGSHSYTCHPHFYPEVEWTIPAFTLQPQSITALWLVLISCPTEGRRLSWPTWLGEILRWFICQRRSPIPVLTGPDVEQPRWYAQRCYGYAMPPPTLAISHCYIPPYAADKHVVVFSHACCRTLLFHKGLIRQSVWNVCRCFSILFCTSLH